MFTYKTLQKNLTIKNRLILFRNFSKKNKHFPQTKKEPSPLLAFHPYNESLSLQ